jgi:hypothetical protein
MKRLPDQHPHLIFETPLPQGQFGLFAWGTTSVEFTSTSVSEEPGTVFVVMQFSDPYQDLYTDVIRRVVNDPKYNLRAYLAGEVFGPGVILEDIIQTPSAGSPAPRGLIHRPRRMQ